MKTTEHTPGPWVIRIGQNETEILGPYLSNKTICTLKNSDYSNSNAHLIAQAPKLLKENEELKALNAELLEALKKLYESFQHTPDNKKGNQAKTDIIKYNQSDVAPALTAARQAIDKAKIN